ncbi:hypothetical protein Pan216_32040 [Planctomycetes bacterium Pan216]|uniref:DUF1573 domain-containing protein n=1 Tax=Kolteria novifilia TaxID=2527975 RepID=A0A518B5T1_9BACT|nr:hypothetical protein Pan216_32040 [Planctomycetes bacterium Pan216]
MKFWVTVISATVVLTGLATALSVWNPDLREAPQTTAATPGEATGPQPRLVPETTFENLTNVPQMKKGESVFKVTNEGEATLELTKGPKKCTCSESFVETTTLQPGESTNFTLKWDTQDRIGSHSLWADLMSNDPEMPKLRFSVNLDIRPEVLVEPSSINFGTVTEGRNVEQAVDIYSTLKEDLEVTKPVISSKGFAVKLVPIPKEKMESLGAKSGKRAIVSVADKLPVGFFEETLGVDTNAEGEPHRSVTINGRCEGAITLLPTQINFKMVPQETGTEKRVDIFARDLGDDGPLKVTNVEPKFLKYKLEQDGDFKSRWKLLVSVPTEAPSGPFTGRVVISDDKGKELIIIRVAGAVSDAKVAGT